MNKFRKQGKGYFVCRGVINLNKKEYNCNQRGASQTLVALKRLIFKHFQYIYILQIVCLGLVNSVVTDLIHCFIYPNFRNKLWHRDFRWVYYSINTVYHAKRSAANTVDKCTPKSWSFVMNSIEILFVIDIVLIQRGHFLLIYWARM